LLTDFPLVSIDGDWFPDGLEVRPYSGMNCGDDLLKILSVIESKMRGQTHWLGDEESNLDSRSQRVPKG
jgi:hypothetical protein